MSVPAPIIVDDADPSIVHDFIGRWGAQQGNGEAYLGTSHHTTMKTAYVVFTFNGTSVEVYGTLLPLPPSGRLASSNYTLDDRKPVTFISHNVSSPAFQQQLYSSPQLTDGPHTLSIAPNLDGPDFNIDFFKYIPSPSSTSTAGSKSTSPSGSHSGSSAGQIAGGVVGGVAALAILSSLLFVFIWRRRRRVNRERADLLATNTAPFLMAKRGGTDATPTPFLPPPPPTSVSPGKPRHQLSTNGMTVSAPINPSALLQPVTSTSVEDSMELEPVRHRDGGAVPWQRAELPPAYEDRVENI